MLQTIDHIVYLIKKTDKFLPKYERRELDRLILVRLEALKNGPTLDDPVEFRKRLERFSYAIHELASHYHEERFSTGLDMLVGGIPCRINVYNIPHAQRYLNKPFDTGDEIVAIVTIIPETSK